MTVTNGTADLARQLRPLDAQLNALATRTQSYIPIASSTDPLVQRIVAIRGRQLEAVTPIINTPRPAERTITHFIGHDVVYVWHEGAWRKCVVTHAGSIFLMAKTKRGIEIVVAVSWRSARVFTRPELVWLATATPQQIAECVQNAHPKNHRIQAELAYDSLVTGTKRFARSTR
jgi:hypothetical protein